MVGIFATVIQRLEAQAGAVHMRVLWALVGRHLRKSMDELHVVSQGVRGRQCVSLRAMTVAGERRPLVEKLTEIFNDFSQVRDVFLDDPLCLSASRDRLLGPGLLSVASFFGSVITYLALACVDPYACPCAMS